MHDNARKLERGLIDLDLPCRDLRTLKGYAYQTGINFKDNFYGANIYCSQHTTKIRVEMRSSYQVAPETCDNVHNVLTTINLRSPRFKWRLMDDGYYALGMEMHDTTVEASVEKLPKVLRDMAKKMATFSPLIDDAASGQKPMREILGALGNVH